MTNKSQVISPLNLLMFNQSNLCSIKATYVQSKLLNYYWNTDENTLKDLKFWIIFVFEHLFPKPFLSVFLGIRYRSKLRNNYLNLLKWRLKLKRIRIIKIIYDYQNSICHHSKKKGKSPVLVTTLCCVPRFAWIPINCSVLTLSKSYFNSNLLRLWMEWWPHRNSRLTNNLKFTWKARKKYISSLTNHITWHLSNKQ